MPRAKTRADMCHSCDELSQQNTNRLASLTDSLPRRVARSVLGQAPLLGSALFVASALRSMTWHAFAVAAAVLFTAAATSIVVLVSTHSVYEKQVELDAEKSRRIVHPPSHN